jgi:hypothetical protein
MPVNFKPAHNIDDAYHACHPELPLEPKDSRYIDLTPVRGGQNLATIITRRIRRTPLPEFHKQLITGHRGCGKSTELKQLQAKLRHEKFFAVYFDVENVLDLGDLNYLGVLLAVARAVAEAMSEAKLKIPQALLKNLDNWFAERILTIERAYRRRSNTLATPGLGRLSGDRRRPRKKALQNSLGRPKQPLGSIR